MWATVLDAARALSESVEGTLCGYAFGRCVCASEVEVNRSQISLGTVGHCGNEKRDRCLPCSWCVRCDLMLQAPEFGEADYAGRDDDRIVERPDIDDGSRLIDCLRESLI